uniref:cyclin-dependent kinase n=1 Tax=Graphocephala atropunctata TaxID=36148 RepID=A0A1B6LNZ8_9HEMI
MDKYVRIAVVGEIPDAIVMSCRHKETGQLVAIKEFVVTENDHYVRKLALREIRMLRKLRHDNLVNMIEVFRHKRKFHLVFEHMSHTVLDELQENPKGLGGELARQYVFQIVRGIEFCHRNGIVHRNISPENILVSSGGVVKLCDFRMARMVSVGVESCTGHVGTRWYRAPELLVADSKYGRPVDVWAVGCLISEIITGVPLFPGESEVDQLYHIVSLLGTLCSRHVYLIAINPQLKDMTSLTLQNNVPDPFQCLKVRFPSWPHLTLDIVSLCLLLDPEQRASTSQLLHHPYFTQDNFSQQFLPEVRRKVRQEFLGNPLLGKFYLQHVEPNMTEVNTVVSEATKLSTKNVFPCWKIKSPRDEGKRKCENQTLKCLYGTANSTVSRDSALSTEEYDDELVRNLPKSLTEITKYSPLKLQTCYQSMSNKMSSCSLLNAMITEHSLQTDTSHTPASVGVMPHHQNLAELAQRLITETEP